MIAIDPKNSSDPELPDNKAKNPVRQQRSSLSGTRPRIAYWDVKWGSWSEISFNSRPPTLWSRHDHEAVNYREICRYRGKLWEGRKIVTHTPVPFTFFPSGTDWNVNYAGMEKRIYVERSRHKIQFAKGIYGSASRSTRPGDTEKFWQRDELEGATVEIYESKGVDRLVPVVFLRCIYFAKLVNRQISKRAQFHQIPMRSATFQA